MNVNKNSFKYCSVLSTVIKIVIEKWKDDENMLVTSPRVIGKALLKREPSDDELAILRHTLYYESGAIRKEQTPLGYRFEVGEFKNPDFILPTEILFEPDMLISAKGRWFRLYMGLPEINLTLDQQKYLDELLTEKGWMVDGKPIVKVKKYTKLI